ncbi:DUF362 domain-containing protein [Aminipila luticellarii]|uniref:Ferredoxin n=1 Tax=Aminipila luticellarii TaxID=2507160 RepID=A0A410PY76_9FIRM|nr:DUF362 domain-containing protein [Aminipila luticellarii]QAT43899.1 DUF362 domain-containing protein [Aminipila luticellarii]
MDKSKVYFTSMKTEPGISLLMKLDKLIRKAGMDSIDFKEKYTAVKVHFGEPGNLAYLRPNYAKVLVDLIKEQGGKPFLTDCNTLYVGGRKNALDHLDSAYVNGFSPFSTGCHVIIADGLKGTDEALIPVKGGEFVKEAKIGRAVMDADIFISLSHFKGHESTGFGGAIKNIGMGCGSRAGKMEQHSAGTPMISQKKCIGCGQCTTVCAQDAIKIEAKKAYLDEEKCVGCGRCIGVCPTDAIGAKWDISNDILNKKMAEYAWAVLNGRPHFHVSLVVDVSPNCDCRPENDIPIVPDIGMFASFDPVALDMACADAVNKQIPISGSLLEEARHKHHPDTCSCGCGGETEGCGSDHFKMTHPDTDWTVCLEHCAKMGIGSLDYELISVK